MSTPPPPKKCRKPPRYMNENRKQEKLLIQVPELANHVSRLQPYRACGGGLLMTKEGKGPGCYTNDRKPGRWTQEMRPTRHCLSVVVSVLLSRRPITVTAGTYGPLVAKWCKWKFSCSLFCAGCLMLGNQSEGDPGQPIKVECQQKNPDMAEPRAAKAGLNWRAGLSGFCSLAGASFRHARARALPP